MKHLFEALVEFAATVIVFLVALGSIVFFLSIL
jgi:hypothetical protein